MYLKKIEIQGFKSFANKTVFDFKEGITAIVGPNGSGKSNVADAIRWVLGEQRVKQLRGGQMQDVIFAGTTSRKAQGFATVAITIDNSDHKLPVAYEEVTVSRSLYRSGESEYAINKTPCRLKDVHELFFDTGIGKEGYSIIGQGQIDRILSSKPEDRRELFDEAAGIVKFKKRKHEALKKLESENSHLQYISELVRIKSKQLGPLKNQSEKAKEYQALLKDAKEIDLQLYVKEEERLQLREKELTKGKEIVLDNLKEVDIQLVESKQTYQEIDQRRQSLENLLKESSENFQHKEEERHLLSRQIEIINTKISEGRGRTKLSEDRLKEIKKDLENNFTEERLIQSQMIEQADIIHKDEEDLNGIYTKETALSKELDLLKEKIEEDTVCIQNILESRGEIISLLSSKKTFLEQNSNVSEGSSKEIENIDQWLIKAEKELVDKNTLKQELKKQIQSTKNEIINLNEITSQKRQNLECLKAKKENLQVKYHKARSNYEVLENMALRYEGLGFSTQKVMERARNYEGVYGIVADLISTKAHLEEAIETAVGARLQNIVTKDANISKVLIDYLYQNKLGRATFLPMDRLDYTPYHFKEGVLNEKGVIGIASHLVEFDKKYEKVINFILDKTLVVENMDAGLSISKKYPYGIRMVTLKGDLLSPQGAMTGGAFKNKNNLLSRKRQLEESKSLFNEIDLKIKDIESEIECLEKSIFLDQKKEEEAQHNLQTLELEDAKNLQFLEQYHFQIQYQKTQRENMISKSSQLRDDLKDLKAEVYQQEILLKKSQEQENSYRIQRAQNQRILENQQVTYNEIMNQKNTLENRLQKSKTKLEFLSQKVDMLLNQRKILMEQQNKNELLNTQDQSQRKTYESEQLSLEGQLEALKEDLIEIKIYIEELEAEKKELTSKNSDFFTQREYLLSTKTKLDQDLFRLDNEINNIKEKRQSYATTLWDDYELTYRGAKSFLETLDLEDVSLASLYKESKEIKSQMKQLGPINLAAIEEYKEVSKEYEFLSAQESDLINASEALKNIISDLDKGMNAQFKESFTGIQKEFDRVFKELFGGGKTSLELMDGENIQEAGIMINVQPPGKKLQNMMQLSGGEKALTAISLLFAILNLKPSPFCLLDEIEAALDDSNVLRFAQYLHQLTRDTQFIIITHRRGTMTTSDRLYGITMQEKGVSTMVSVNLVEDSLTN